MRTVITRNTISYLHVQLEPIIPFNSYFCTGSSSDGSESDERDVPSVSIVRYGDSWKSAKVLEKNRSPGWKR